MQQAARLKNPWFLKLSIITKLRCMQCKWTTGQLPHSSPTASQQPILNYTTLHNFGLETKYHYPQVSFSRASCKQEMNKFIFHLKNNDSAFRHKIDDKIILTIELSSRQHAHFTVRFIMFGNLLF